jgi:hypothetical protein
MIDGRAAFGLHPILDKIALQQCPVPSGKKEHVQLMMIHQ